jgi:hypothetical protein
MTNEPTEALLLAELVKAASFLAHTRRHTNQGIERVKAAALAIERARGLPVPVAVAPNVPDGPDTELAEAITNLRRGTDVRLAALEEGQVSVGTGRFLATIVRAVLARPAAGRDLTAQDVQRAYDGTMRWEPIANYLNRIARPAVARTDGQPPADDAMAERRDHLRTLDDVFAVRAALLGVCEQAEREGRDVRTVDVRAVLAAPADEQVPGESGPVDLPGQTPMTFEQARAYIDAHFDASRADAAISALYRVPSAAPADDTAVQGWGDVESADFIERARAATAVGSFTAQFDHVYDPSGDFVCESVDHSTAVRIAAALSGAPAHDTAAPDAPWMVESRDERVDRLTRHVENVADCAGIEIEVREAGPLTGPAPLRRLVRALEGAGMLHDDPADDTAAPDHPLPWRRDGNSYLRSIVDANDVRVGWMHPPDLAAALVKAVNQWGRRAIGVPVAVLDALPDRDPFADESPAGQPVRGSQPEAES